MKRIFLLLLLLGLIMPLTLWAATGFADPSIAPPEGFTSRCSYLDILELCQMVFIALSVILLVIWLIRQNKKIKTAKSGSLVLWLSPLLILFIAFVSIVIFRDFLTASNVFLLKNLGYLTNNLSALIVSYLIFAILLYFIILFVRFIIYVIKKQVRLKKLIGLLIAFIVLGIIYVLAFWPGMIGQSWVDSLCSKTINRF